MTTFLMRGYDPFEDIAGYGEVIALVRQGVAEREGAATGVVEPHRAKDGCE